MNVIAFRFWNFSYSNGMSVACRLNNHFKFDNVFCLEKTEDMEKVRKTWEGDNLSLIDIYKDVPKFKFLDMDLDDMPPLSRESIEKLALDRCRLYQMHRDETLTFRELDKEIMDYFRYWNHILDTYKIDLYLCNSVPHVILTYSLYAVCKLKGIKTLFVARSCIPGYSYCHDDIFAKFERLERAYRDALESGEPYELSDYMRNGYAEKMMKDSYQVPSSYKMSHTLRMQAEKGQKITPNMLPQLLLIHRWPDYVKFLYGRIHKAHLRKSVPKKADKHYKKLSCAADYSKKYIYVPLQLQPEASTSPLGNVYVDTVLMVKTISYCIKDTDIQLYIKEHGDQTKVFRLSRKELYDNLNEIPGAVLIRKEESSYKLQDNCIASANCSGTVIMESLFKGKPVLVFGNQMNNLAPNALQVYDIQSCRAAIDKILAGEVSVGDKERDAYLYAVERSCIHGFVRSERAAAFGVTQDESAENTYLELVERIGEWLSERR